MPERLRILLADDHNLVRGGLKALIDSQEDMEVVAEAADGTSACELAIESVPCVAVLDVSMPGLTGPQAAARIRRECPDVKILALTVHEDRGYLEQLMRAGASGYMLKRAAVGDLIHAIRTVARGDSYLDPTMTSLLMARIGGRTSDAPTAKGTALSDREEEVLRLVARGHTNREIAVQLDVSIKTVETHKARGMEKLGVDSRAGIVAFAIRSGWMSEA